MLIPTSKNNKQENGFLLTDIHQTNLEHRKHTVTIKKEKSINPDNPNHPPDQAAAKAIIHPEAQKTPAVQAPNHLPDQTAAKTQAATLRMVQLLQAKIIQAQRTIQQTKIIKMAQRTTQVRKAAKTQKITTVTPKTIQQRQKTQNRQTTKTKKKKQKHLVFPSFQLSSVLSESSSSLPESL